MSVDGSTSPESSEPAKLTIVLEQELLEITKRKPGTAPDRTELTGLSLSGGGIRSATFCLGVLQALNIQKMLPLFDYLSTVSGGGYVGGWWSAWLSRKHRESIFPELERIRSEREALYCPERRTESALSAGDDPIHHLRLFSNYLTPRKGGLSADTWRAVTFYLRNLVLTWMILLPLLVSVILVGQLYFAYLQTSTLGTLDRNFSSIPYDRTVLSSLPPLFLGGLIFMLIACWIANTQSPRFGKGKLFTSVKWRRLLRSGKWIWSGFSSILAFAITVWLLHEMLGAISSSLSVAERATFKGYFNYFVLGWSLAALACIVWCLWQPDDRQTSSVTESKPQENTYWRRTVFRNRLTRLTQLLLPLTIGLTLLLILSGFGGELFEWLFIGSDPNGSLISVSVTRYGGWAAMVTSATGVLFTVWKGAPSGGGDMHTESRRSMASRVVFALAPPLALLFVAIAAADIAYRLQIVLNGPLLTYVRVFGFAASLLCLSFCFLDLLWNDQLKSLLTWSLAVAYLFFLIILTPSPADVLPVSLRTTWLQSHFVSTPWSQLSEPVRLVLAMLAAMIGWVGVFGWSVDPNELSLHSFYKARLVRAYLGASNYRRCQNNRNVTDSVPGDDRFLKSLRNCDSKGPYHLINATLNLVGGRDLATAQRLAEPFLFSQLYCGSSPNFRPTKQYLGGSLTLGTCIAVSGAAASPNMGSVTPTSSLAMLMTAMNIRLGYWAPTPNRPAWKARQTRHWPWYTIREFLSQTTDRSTYCYLTDGGHFDNTGLYALVQRGCRYILAVDCGADPKPCFQDLGNVIRRCRIDFGTDIDIDISTLSPRDAPGGGAHFTFGTIRYDKEHLTELGWPLELLADEQNRQGIIILIKPVVTAGDGKLPVPAADVRQYKLTNEEFPQQSTVDQWFGEAEFESYRLLGDFSATAMLDNIEALKKLPVATRLVFQELQQRARPTEQQVRQRAYDIWCHRNGGPGNDVDDWRQAEAELRSHRIPS